jgi:hypothetical protein
MCAVLLSLLIYLSDIAFAQGPAKDADYVQALRDLGVEPTKEGIGKFLDSIAKGKYGPVTARDADKLIAELGDDDYDTREAATKRLLAMIFPPFEKLGKAAKSTDAEVAKRARGILNRFSTSPDPVLAIFQAARARSVPLAASKILPVLVRCEGPARLEAAQDAFVVAVGKADLALVRRLLDDKDLRVKAAAIRALGAIRKEDAAGELAKLLKSKDEPVRCAAARALAGLGKVMDYKKYTADLGLESRVLVLRDVERRFRRENKDNRGKPGVMGDYDKLLGEYAAALAKLKTVKQEKKAQQNTDHWIKLGLDTSKHPEVLMYRIQWIAGGWSGWYMPGFNDREVGKGRNIRMWSCFNDHNYEVITTTDKTRYREVQDLP